MSNRIILTKNDGAQWSNWYPVNASPSHQLTGSVDFRSPRLSDDGGFTVHSCTFLRNFLWLHFFLFPLLFARLEIKKIDLFKENMRNIK